MVKNMYVLISFLNLKKTQLFIMLGLAWWRTELVTMSLHLCFYLPGSASTWHIELVNELSTNGFIACLNRFIAREIDPPRLFPIMDRT